MTRPFSILALALCAGLSLSAQEGTHWVFVHGTHTRFDSDFPASNEGGYGLSYGGWLTNGFGVEARAVRTDLRASTAGALADGDQTQYFGSALFNLNPAGSKVFPYVAAGLGLTQTSAEFSDSGRRTARINYHAGVGVQWRVGELFAVSADSKYVQTQAASNRRDWVNSLGLGMVWGR
ncbi:outer membrane beta-barrel protein [Geothrix sp. 21YS21S-4]|uniref:outer membrane beta-barrel protein n=1 Tax=Geothrix sp. 21YS21S-4 TaxID=3068889 RepID=UPI0027B94865|nr:outer membrane beta-barrel protein [Geothrix sp. 21YS21S-4]